MRSPIRLMRVVEHNMEPRHDSVLVKEVLGALRVAPGDTVIDATLGGAGHFKELLAALGEGGIIVGIDADPAAVERAREAYARDRRPERPVAHLVNDNFRNLARILERLGVGGADAILFDLGWSGYQVAAPRSRSHRPRTSRPPSPTPCANRHSGNNQGRASPRRHDLDPSGIWMGAKSYS